MGFVRYALDDLTLLDDLLAHVDLGQVTDGRQGTHLTRPGPDGVPLVRTTTRYAQPATVFSPAHARLADAVSDLAGVGPFDNALLEVYDRRYRSMGWHCDQALDLAPGSHIAIVSGYSGPATGADTRALFVQHKDTGERQVLELVHGSVVVFSLADNAVHRHKIVLPGAGTDGARWVGLTLRRSKTHLRFHDGIAWLPSGRPLRLADPAEQKRFYSLRGEENRSCGFSYPPLDFTLSPADLLSPQGMMRS